MHAVRHHRFSYAEYLRLAEEANVRLEFADGSIFAMAGGSREHAAIAANLIAALTIALRGQPCQAHSSDLRVRVRATGLATYPDVTVICGRAELDEDDPKGHTVTNPTLLCEVLSPSTEDYDRGEKLAHYRQIPSLREVLLVSPSERTVERHSRGTDGTWLRSLHAERVPLEALGAELAVAELLRDPLGGAP